MPRRWLSFRGQPEKNTPIFIKHSEYAGIVESDKTSSPNAFVASNQSTKATLPPRPSTAAGGEMRPLKRARVESSIGRPHSSGGPIHVNDTNLLHVNVDKTLIGVAVGSPSHPPKDYPDLSATMTPQTPKHAFAYEGPFPLVSRQKSKWKSFSGFFKHRQSPKKKKPFYSLGVVENQQETTVHPQDTCSYPLSSTMPGQQTSTPSNTTSLQLNKPLPPQPIDDDGHENLKQNDKDRPILGLQIPDRPASAAGKLEGTERNCSTTKTGNTRKRTNTYQNVAPGLNEKIADSVQDHQHPSDPVVRPASAMSDLKSTASRYSLFPSSMSPPKVPQPVTSSHIGSKSRSRATTASSSVSLRKCRSERTLSDASDFRYTGGRGFHNTADGQERKTTSTDREDTRPWSSLESIEHIPSSRTSVDEEIFFDIKSFRSSTVPDGKHFIMTRPNSSVVELARTMSKKRKLTGESADFMESPDMDSDNDMSASTQIEETIAAVQKLTSSSQLSLPSIVLDPSNKIIGASSGDIQTVTTHSTSTDRRPPPLSTLKRKTSQLLTRLEENIDVPSPVFEHAEEASPRFDTHARREVHSTLLEEEADDIALNQGSMILSRPPSSLRLSFSPTPPPAWAPPEPPRKSPPPCPKRSPPLPPTPAEPDASETVDHSQPAEALAADETRPPLIPPKNAGYIPLSRFAAIGTVDTVVERSGLRPSLPARSATETLAQFNPRSSSLPANRKPDVPGRLTRSSTAPEADLLKSLPDPESFRSRAATIASTTAIPASGDSTVRTNTSLSTPAPNSPPQAELSSPLTEHVNNPNHSSPKPSTRDLSTILTVVTTQPAAEVAVARSVSLSRTRTTKVEVSRSNSTRKLQSETQLDENQQVTMLHDGTDLGSSPARSVLPAISAGSEVSDTDANSNVSVSNSTPQLSAVSPISPFSACLVSPDGVCSTQHGDPLVVSPIDADFASQENSQFEPLSHAISTFTCMKSQEEVSDAKMDPSQQILINKAKALTPTVNEGHQKHKTGLSMNLVIEAVDGNHVNASRGSPTSNEISTDDKPLQEQATREVEEKIVIADPKMAQKNCSHMHATQERSSSRCFEINAGIVA